MDERLEVQLEQVGGTSVVRASGEIDIATAPKLRDCLAEVAEGTRIVIVDLSAVTFLDSTALSVLVAGWKRFSSDDEGEEAELRLVVVRPVIQRVLDVTGLAKVFSIFSTLEQAIQG
jgi:anti-sigma B factor antagonist